MPVPVQCPNPACGKTASVPESHLGQKARCKQCGQAFTLQATPATVTRRREPQIKTTARMSAASGMSDASATIPDLPGKIGRFQIRHRLGSGAFGTVYRAFDPELQREVALKVPQDGALDDAEAIERFLREARAAARLRHEHIVAVFDAGKDGDIYYIASAYIAGKTLADAIDSDRPKLRQATEVVRALALALDHAHEQGIVHRDVKPANVMVDDNGQPFLMDFGLAHRAEADTKLTRDGSVLGTPAYMAPEQAAGQRGEAQPASDQYSLGVVLYELLTGRLPFEGPLQVVLYLVQNTEPPAPRQLRPDVPADLETICQKAMAKRPGDRYPDCRALAADLGRWLAGEPIEARPVGPLGRLTRWCRRRPAIAGAAAVLIAGLLTGTALLAGRIEMGVPKNTESRTEKANEATSSPPLPEPAPARVEYKARLLSGRMSRILAIRFSPTGAMLLAGDANGQLKRWDVATGQFRGDFLDGKQCKAMAISPDGGTAATAGEWDMTGIKLWNVASGAERMHVRFDEDGWNVHYLAFTPDNKKLLVAGIASKLGTLGFATRQLEVDTGKQISSWKPAGPVWNGNGCPTFTPDGKLLATLGVGLGERLDHFTAWGHIRDGGTGTVRCALVGREVNDIRLMEFSPDGRWLATTSGAKTLWLRDAATGAVLEQCELSGDKGFTKLAFAPDGKTLAVATYEGDVLICRLTLNSAGTRPKLDEIARLPLGGDTVMCLAFSPDNATLVTGATNGTVILWRPAGP